MYSKVVPSIELGRLSELIHTIYQGATDPARWKEALPAIADWLGADRGVLYTPVHKAEDGGFIFTHEITDAMVQLWWTRYYTLDVWRLRSTEQGLVEEGSVIVGEEVVPTQEFIQTKIYREFFSNYDMTHLLTGVVYGVEATQPVFCALLRGMDAGPFTPYDRDRMNLLVPHLSRALGVMRQLRDTELRAISSLTALDQINTAVLLFGAHGQVTFANRAACHILEEEDGVHLRRIASDDSRGELVVDDSKAHAALRKAIAAAISPDILNTDHFSRAVMLPRPSGRADYTLNFSSLAEQNEFGSEANAPRAIAFITDSAQPIRLNEELLKDTYGLTPAELRVIEMMTEGLTIDEASSRLGLSSHTVRAQLKSVYAKTNINNRAKLMRLVISISQGST